MTLVYGCLKGRLQGTPALKASRRRREIQYHLHMTVLAAGEPWDIAVNVGTNDADDLLNYRLVYDFHHPIRDTLTAAASGFTDLTQTRALPALDFARSDILSETGAWRLSDVLDGSDLPEPVASLKRMLDTAASGQRDLYVFGRTYNDGTLGVHDIHQNQGSTGSFLNNGRDDHNDHNDIWQDGAVIADLGSETWAAYFTAFTQQLSPTDELGNPMPGARPIGNAPR